MFINLIIFFAILILVNISREGVLMEMTKLKTILTAKATIGVLSALIGLGIGSAMITGEKTEVETKYNELNIKYEEDAKNIKGLEEKVSTINEKLVQAKPWFALSADEKGKIEQHQKDIKLAAEKKVEEERVAAEKIEQERLKVEKVEQQKIAEEAKVKAEAEAKIQASKPDITGIKTKVQDILNQELAGDIENTIINNITINENLGTEDNTKDVIVLVDLTWSTLNGEKSTRSMIDMYGSHIAAKLAPILSEGSEICTFWDATYTGLQIKHATYVKNGGAYKQ